MLTPRRLFLDLGGLDETTFARRVQRQRLLLSPDRERLPLRLTAGAELVHHEGIVTRLRRQSARGRRVPGALPRSADPWYSPHLSLDDELFRIRARAVSSRSAAPHPHLRVQPLSQLYRRAVDSVGGGRGPDGAGRSSSRSSPACRTARCASAMSASERRSTSSASTRWRPSSAARRRTTRRWKRSAVRCARVEGGAGVRQHARHGVCRRRCQPRRHPDRLEHPRERGLGTNFYRYGPRLARRCVEAFAKPYRVVFGCDATRGRVPILEHGAQLQRRSATRSICRRWTPPRRRCRAPRASRARHRATTTSCC